MRERAESKGFVERAGLPYPIFPVIGGHGGMLKDSADTVLKPVMSGVRGEREVAHYLRQQQHRDIPQDLTPVFYGIVLVSDSGTTRPPPASDQSAAALASSDKGRAQAYLRLRDMTAPFSAPCVCDIKLGTVTWGADASAAKIARMKAKYPHQERVGFRFTGMRVYKPAMNAFVQHDRSFGMSLNPDNMEEGVKELLHDGERYVRDVIPGIIERARRVRDWAAGAGRRYRLIGTSLLIVYEGDPAAREKAMLSLKRSGGVQDPSTAPLLDVRLIDFAHCFVVPEPDDGREIEPDVNFLTGIDNFIATLERAHAMVQGTGTGSGHQGAKRT